VPLDAYLERWRWSALWVTALGGTAVVIAVERRWLAIPALSVAGLVAGTFLFHLAAIRDGIWYGSDAALYLIHARNIVEGQPYSETGYLVNPTHRHSPATYPPLFPLMLAPIYAVAGLALHAMKVLVVATTALATAALYLLARRALPIGASLTVAWLFAFSPFIGWLKDDLASDIPFLAAVFFCLWAAEKAQSIGTQTDAGWRRGAVVGLLCYAAVATRTVGIVLLPALLIADIARVRRLSPYAVGFSVTALSLIGLQEALLGNVRAYSSLTTWGGLEQMADSVVRNARFLTGILFGDLPPAVQRVAMTTATAAASYGVLLLLRRRWYSTVLFITGYTAMLLLWPNTSGPRLLLPHFALGLIFGSVALWPGDGRHHWRKAIAAALVALCVTSYAVRYRGSTLAPLPDSFDRPEHAELVAFVHRETSPNDVFISIAPRTFALLTRRTASIYDRRLSLENQWRYFASIRASYVVARRGSGERDAAYLSRVIRTYREHLKLEFSNAAYEVYHIVPGIGR